MSKIVKSTLSSRAIANDWISKMPDEVLIMVVSRLGMKEAARTSVLSHRWRSLWKFYRGRFDFDARMRLLLLWYGKNGLCPVLEVCKYVNWVNQVIDSHQSCSVEELRVCFDLDRRYTNYIDRWFDFAISRSVRRLEFDLSPSSSSPLFKPERPLPYSFPTWLLNWPLGFSDIKALTSLRLRSVDLTEEIVHFFLSNCPMLEHLCIDYAPSLCNLTIAGDSLKLKHLEITNCLGLKSLHISTPAPNLVFLKYWGRGIDMVLENAPRLSSLSLGGKCCRPLILDEIDSLPFSLSRVEELALDLPLVVCPHIVQTSLEFTELRKLELKFYGLYSDCSILCLTSFVHASPRLERLVLNYEFQRETGDAEFFKDAELFKFPETRQVKHECLKEVEFYGWVGLKADFELATRLIETAVSLEKIMITPCHPDDPERWNVSSLCDEKIKEAQSRARRLHPKLRSSETKLIIF